MRKNPSGEKSMANRCATGSPRRNDLVDRGMALDNFYVPSRYPNGHPEGAPFEHFGKLQSSEALTHAGAILDFVRAEMAGS